MRTQRLGFVGLGDDTVSACLSMLKIIDGRSSVHWDQSVPGDADVLMVACDQQEQTRQTDLSDKPCIVVYPTTRDRPASTFTLPHPFRVMQLLDVLDEVVRTLATDSNHDRPSAIIQPAKPGSVADFCASLHRVTVAGQTRQPPFLCPSRPASCSQCRRSNTIATGTLYRSGARRHGRSPPVRAGLAHRRQPQ